MVSKVRKVFTKRQGETFSWQQGYKLDKTQQSMVGWECVVSLVSFGVGERGTPIFLRPVTTLTSDELFFGIRINSADTEFIPAGQYHLMVQLTNTTLQINAERHYTLDLRVGGVVPNGVTLVTPPGPFGNEVTQTGQQTAASDGDVITFPTPFKPGQNPVIHITPYNNAIVSVANPGTTPNESFQVYVKDYSGAPTVGGFSWAVTGLV